MNKFLSPLPLALLAAGAFAQSQAIYPSDYVNVPEGPFNSPNLPLARGTSRVLCLYEDIDLDIPNGDQITSIGFREDATITTMDSGTALQLEVRMGWTTEDHVSMSTNFDNNYAAPPVTVFGPALFTLPNLRDPGSPLTDGKFFIDLTTPFAYTPNGRNLLVEYRVFGTAQGGSSFNYRLDRADFYSPVTYGPAGCTHPAGGPPNLTLQPTRPGFNFQANISAAPANAPAFLAINLGNSLATPYPLGIVFAGVAPSCTGQMNPSGIALLGGVTNNGGAANWSFFIPNDNTWGKFTISSQAVFLDFFAPGQVVSSNGGEVLTGIRPRTSIIANNGAPTVLTTGSKSQWYCPVAFFKHQ